MNDPKLTIPEAAKAIGISSNSLRRLIAEGRLPVLKILPRKILIRSSDVEKLLTDSRCFIRKVEPSYNRLPPLPPEVINSPHLRIGCKA
jgi:excisionase family DNA binding protein